MHIVPPADFKYFKAPFLRDFWHLNVAMMTSNNALVPYPDKHDILVPNPLDWPWDAGYDRGQGHLSLTAIVCDSDLHIPLLGLVIHSHYIPACLLISPIRSRTPTTYNSANIPGHSNTQISIQMAEKPSRTTIPHSPQAESPCLWEEACLHHVLER